MEGDKPFVSGYSFDTDRNHHELPGWPGAERDLIRADVHPEVVDVERCATCGEPVPVGAWPFCTSPANPAGHTRGTYRWKTKFSMKLQGWTRRER